MAKYVLLKNKETGKRSIRITGGEIVQEDEDPIRYADLRKRAIRNLQASEKDDAMRSCGLTKVRGACGGTFWE